MSRTNSCILVAVGTRVIADEEIECLRGIRRFLLLTNEISFVFPGDLTSIKISPAHLEFKIKQERSVSRNLLLYRSRWLHPLGLVLSCFRDLFRFPRSTIVSASGHHFSIINHVSDGDQQVLGLGEPYILDEQISLCKGTLANTKAA